MPLRLPDKWVWDSWIADTGSEFHLFYLQAPRSLREESLRHRNATIGHAVSIDLRRWQVVEDALTAGPPGAWDDVATWTGSVIEHRGVWHLFYTGVTVRDARLEQGIGLATSTDLTHWHKVSFNPVLEMDHRWYELSGFDAWRDPWVLRDPGGKGFHLLVTARAREGGAFGGVIGHAWSADLVSWRPGPPLTSPGMFGHLEVPQVEEVEGTPILLFSVASDRLPVGFEGANTSFVVAGESLLGPWDLRRARPILVPDLYAARLVRDRAGDWQVIGFRDGSGRGAFVGELTDPIPFRDLGLI